MTEIAAVPPPPVDLVEAERFLDFMPGDEALTFQTFDDKRGRKDGRLARIVHGTIETQGAELVRLNASGAGIFWMVNVGDGKGRSAENVVKVRAVFADLDGAPLQPVLHAKAKPHAIIESSPARWQVYWLVTDCTLPQFEPVQLAIAKKFDSDTNVHDLPRVMRAPGFFHPKGVPFRTRIISTSDHAHFAIDELVALLELDLNPASPERTLIAPSKAFASETPERQAEILKLVRAALAHVPAHDRALWVKVAHCLYCLGEAGREIFDEWSRTSDAMVRWPDAPRHWRRKRTRWRRCSSCCTGSRSSSRCCFWWRTCTGSIRPPRN